MKMLFTAFACVLIGTASAEGTASLGLWIVDSQPFADAVKSTVNELRLDGYAKIAPDLSLDSIASVEKMDFIVPLERTEGRGDLFLKPDGVLVKLQLGPEQVPMVAALLRANVGKRVLLRLGDTPIAAAEIHMITSLDGTGTKHIKFSNFSSSPQVWPQVWGAASDKNINLHYRNDKDADGIFASLTKLIQPKTEQAGAGQPATKPAEKGPAKNQPSTPTPKELPR